MKTKVASGCLLLALSACAFPMPHFARSTPPIVGRLVAEANAGAGDLRVRVYPGSVSDCSNYSRETTSDQTGSFSLAERRHFRFFLYMMAHSRFRYGLCIEQGAAFVPAIQFEDYTLVDTGPIGTIRVECELRLLSAQPQECGVPRRFNQQLPLCACQIMERLY